MSKEIRNFMLAPDATYTKLIAHRIDCPKARAQADRGEMVMTLLNCAEPLDDKTERHECLKEYAH